MANAVTIDTGRRGPDGRHRAKITPVAQTSWRILLVLAAGTAAFLNAPAYLASPLTVAAAIVVTEWAVRYRRKGLLDAALVGAAGLIVGAVLLGLLLNLMPLGLTRQTWSVGAVVIGVNVLVLGLRSPMPAGLFGQLRRVIAAPVGGPVDGSRNWPGRLAGVVCSVLAAFIIAGALVATVHSTERNQIDPLQMAAVSTPAGTSITLTTGTPDGPFDLVVIANGVSVTAATGLHLDATGVSVPIVVPAIGRALVDLVRTGEATPVRQLIFDAGGRIQ